ncbi:hypothetical protein HDU96_000411 [Phlyctochytrium bullatum]|nr:hypothetical protein HDU96_000411 [Phlyctochytrium bullatum]
MTEQNIDQLAKERKAEKGEKESKFAIAIPIWRSRDPENTNAETPQQVLIILIISGAIVAIVAPMATTFLGTSRSSIGDISTISIQGAVSQAAQGVSNAISTTVQVLDQMYSQPFFPAEFTNSAFNVAASSTLFPAILRGLRTFDYISALVCCNTGPTATGPFGNFTNNTNLQALWTPFLPGMNGVKTAGIIYGGNVFLAVLRARGLLIMFFLSCPFSPPTHADPSTGGMNMLLVYNSNFSVITRTPIGPRRVQPLSDLVFYDLMSANPSRDPYFGVTRIVNGNTSFFQMSYYRLFWPANGARPTMGCSIGYIIDDALTPLLNSIRVTPNTIVMLIEKSTGLLLATNRQDSIALNGTRVTPDRSNNTEVRVVGRGLMELYNNNISQVTNVSLLANPVVQRRLDDGQEWFLSSNIINVRGTEFMVSVGFPRSDMFSQIDAAERRGLIIAICVAVAGTLVTGAATFLALRPLYFMAISMKQLTKFDFSSLENGALDRRSFMYEIRQVETVFDQMVVAFAGAIKKNKALIQGQMSSAASRPSVSGQGQGTTSSATATKT